MDQNDKSTNPLALPLLLLAAAFFLTTAFQTYILFQNGSNLVNARLGQTQAVEQSLKVRQQLDALAGKTAKLADQGNANAKTIIEDLKKQGVSVKANN